MNDLDLSAASWRKSSRSGGQGGECVEVAALASVMAVRDSKDPEGPSCSWIWRRGERWRIGSRTVSTTSLDSPSRSAGDLAFDQALGGTR
ncbi:DUF397 domain-containing protein [Actinomadura keratinilytica]|uniref:DUF397 domain-containing protein n=1 Tax=Actinomadura keratinilytica TaxID=547461 RepID=UPI0031ECF7ED